VTHILDKRLIFVCGKGGVGKSTVAIALGMATARRGRRTIVAEVAHQHRVASAFHADAAEFSEVQLSPGLWTISIDPEHALEEYLLVQIKVKPLADLLGSSRMFQYLAAATPGLREMVTIGKVWELAQDQRRTRGSDPYDVVIVDAPATGHGVAFMRTPKTFADIARGGPVANQGRTIHELIVDPRRTGVVAVALPEEMPVNETLDLSAELHAELGVEIDRVVVNGLYPERFSARERDSIEQGLDRAGTPVERAALRAALSQHQRARAQREQVARLEERLDAEAAELPYLFAPELDRSALEELSDRLEAAL
jgi:anion-transporting  ArsA/GET3 family ATPase